MRTPIQTLLFMLQIIINFFSAPTIQVEEIPYCINCCTIMMSQLEFLLSFVEDLLDLRQLRDGVFSLASEPIDVA